MDVERRTVALEDSVGGLQDLVSGDCEREIYVRCTNGMVAYTADIQLSNRVKSRTVK